MLTVHIADTKEVDGEVSSLPDRVMNGQLIWNGLVNDVQSAIFYKGEAGEREDSPR